MTRVIELFGDMLSNVTVCLGVKYRLIMLIGKT